MADKKTSREVAEVNAEANKSIFSDKEMRSIQSAADVAALFDSIGAEVESFADYGSGFTILANKDRLLDTKFVILEWRFTKSVQYGSEFVSFACVTEQGEKYIVNDGSTGIYKQLRAITDERVKNGKPNPQVALRVDGGLRVSRYKQDVIDEKSGEVTGEREATTYYLA